MEIINFFNCSNHYEARIKEQEYFVLLNANLNSIEPLPPPKPLPIKQINPIKVTYHCDGCNVDFDSLIKFTIHNQTNKHVRIMETPNKSAKFNCEKCNYNTSNKKDFDKHCVTRKHMVLNNLEQISPKIYLTKINVCKHCNKEYNSRNGLWYHEKKCTLQSDIDKIDIPLLENSFVAVGSEPVEPSDNSLIMELIKQNKEFKEMMIEQNKQILELMGIKKLANEAIIDKNINLVL